MENKKLKILLAVIGVLVCLSVVLVFFQYRRKVASEKINTSPNGSTANQLINSSQQDNAPFLPAYLVEGKKKELAQGARDVIGKVLTVSENNVAIEAEIVDLDQISQAKSVDDLPKKKQIYQVAVNGDTKFVGLGLKEVTKDNPIRVFAKELVYSTDKLTAEQIIYPYNQGANSAQEKKATAIMGKVKAIGSASVQIYVSISKDHQKTYKVMIDSETKITKKDEKLQDISDIKLSDIRAGDNILASSSDDISQKSEFVAQTVSLLSPPPQQKNN